MSTTPDRRNTSWQFGRLWNWKSALVSALVRAPIFFAANLRAGLDAATAALVTELVYRMLSAGFFGALTEFFARRPGRRAATWQAVFVLPALAHSIEYLVHRQAGTPHIGTAMVGSVAVSVLTTRLSLFVMRRGLFVAGRQSFAADLIGLAALCSGSLSAWRRRAGAGVIKMPLR